MPFRVLGADVVVGSGGAPCIVVNFVLSISPPFVRRATTTSPCAQGGGYAGHWRARPFGDFIIKCVECIAHELNSCDLIRPERNA